MQAPTKSNTKILLRYSGKKLELTDRSAAEKFSATFLMLLSFNNFAWQIYKPPKPKPKPKLLPIIVSIFYHTCERMAEPRIN